MKKILHTMALTLSFILIGCSGQNFTANACDDATSRLVAHAYVLSVPIFGKENELVPYMTSNPESFTENGKAIQCMQNLGSALINQAMAQNHPYEDYTAREMFGGQMPEGLGDLPGQVDASMNSYANDTITMGGELLWLSHVLPPAAQGNYTPYNSTATPTRQVMLQSIQMYVFLCQMSPGLCQMMQDMFQQMEPQLEQTVYELARQVGS